MNGPEFLALTIGLYCFVGLFLNYNVVYARLNKTHPWWLTRRHSKGFYHIHKRLRWAIYVATFVWFGVFMILFAEKGLWLTSVLMALYLATRVPAWFVLGPRTGFLNKHDALKRLGPNGDFA